MGDMICMHIVVRDPEIDSRDGRGDFLLGIWLAAPALGNWRYEPMTVKIKVMSQGKKRRVDEQLSVMLDPTYIQLKWCKDRSNQTFLYRPMSIIHAKLFFTVRFK